MQISESPDRGKNNPTIRLTVEIDGGQRRTFAGRDAWCLGELIGAGFVGCTPIERPAPRWSHYVFKLRRAGLNVETIDEKHGGAYAGCHARYVLKTPVRVVEVVRQSDRVRGVAA